eukprot:TRINITY_DN687_c0_g1_i1.p1 TRINITY_DN687_c0_g1~~TRINITY_DN687_c0_g1_i1.p1  ORF type:complete len:420 (+),score=190.70 TRINITY_DN687_c0_g1_i1:69-1328(+)
MAQKTATISDIPAVQVMPEHDEDYESSDDGAAGPPDAEKLKKSLSMVPDKKLKNAIGLVRKGSQSELKEACIKSEWYGAASSDADREMLKDCVMDDDFWAEVKELARIELDTKPEVMNDDKFREMFRRYDEDDSGAIEAPELQKLLAEAMGMEADMEEVIDLMRTVDEDDNGEIDEDEFLKIMNLAKKHQEESADDVIDFIDVEGGCLAQAKLEESKAVWEKRKAAQQMDLENMAAQETPEITLTPPHNSLDPTSPDRPAPGPRPAGRPLAVSAGCGAAPGMVKPRSQVLYDQALRTDDEEKKKKILADAAVEEYKEMLKKKAMNARLKEERKIEKEKQLQRKLNKGQGMGPAAVSPPMRAAASPPTAPVEPPAGSKTKSLGGMTKPAKHADPAAGTGSTSGKKPPGKSLTSLSARTKK